MSVSKRAASIALAAAGVVSLGSMSASAAPYLNVSLLGSTNAGGPFTSSVSVTPGQTVFYQVSVKLGNEGATNAAPSAVLNRTITNWVPSDGSQAVTAGLNFVAFSLSQSSADGIQSSFSAGVAGTTTGGAQWGGGAGSSPGVVTARGNGNNNLIGAKLFRPTGDYDGVAGTPGTDPSPATLETLGVATGSFATSGSGTGTVNIDLTGLSAATAVATYRWRTADNTAQQTYSQTVANQTTSVTNTDPLIIFTPLQLVPEPATLGLLGMGALGLLARRRRA